jgi:hypothetical protein
MEKKYQEALSVKSVSSDKDLKEKAVNIKGKKYVMVSDRVVYFNDTYRSGSISTELVSYDSGNIVVRATVVPDVSIPERFFTGFAQESEGSSFINKTSALENAETSAVGRALGMMGIGVLDGIASVDEINKAKNAKPKKERLTTERLKDAKRAILSGEYKLEQIKKDFDLTPEQLKYLENE